MKPSVEILEELNGISPFLAQLERKEVFAVPEGYFDYLPAMILQQLDSTNHVSLPSIEDPLQGSVPEGYFDSLAGNIMNKIRHLQQETASDEITRISPALSSLQRVNVFSVPEGYFSTLTGNILEAAKPATKIVVMKRRSPVWKIAAAAMVTGMIAVSSLWVSQKPAYTKTGVAFHNQDSAAPSDPNTMIYATDEDINEGIAKLSDDEIVKYLQNTGNAADNEVLTATIEGKELPDQQDYLLDEKTLDKYLDKIETNVSN